MPRNVPQVTITRVAAQGLAIAPQYNVKFRGYEQTDANLTKYRNRTFRSLQAAREYANSIMLDAMGIF